jgi:hypothetical protein
MQRLRHWKPIAGLTLLACVAVVAPAALGAFGPLASFGPAGAGAGTIGLRAPAVAVDANGRVYVADSSDGRIEAFTNDGTADGGWGGLNAPSGVAAAPDGTIVVADRAGVYRFDAAGTLLGTLATTGDAFATPAGVAVGSDGTVYVADPVRHRVVALGGAVYGPVPAPVAVAVAADGSVFVADGGGDRIDVFSAAGAPLRSWAAHHPAGIALTSDGTVLVSDTEHDLLQRFSATGTSLGTTGDLDNPRGVATDCRDRAYVEDDAALRVHVFGEPGPPPPCTLPPPPPPPPVVIAPEPDPVLGTTARATAVSGDILVGEGNNLHELHGHEILPVGSTIDADDGHVKVELETKAGPDRDKYGRFMEAEFFDGSFTLNQTKTDSLANLDLIEDGDVARTRATSSSKRASKKALRLWGKAHGRFRTRGRNGAATVQGTQWLTSEHVDGTLFRVVEGVVAVKDFTTGKTIVLHPGESYLAKPPCVSRRAFRIRLRVDPSQIKNVIVTVRGKRVKVRRGSRLTAPVDLRGAPDGKVKVKIFARTSDGRVLIGERQYLTCLNAVRIPKDPPEL